MLKQKPREPSRAYFRKTNMSLRFFIFPIKYSLSVALLTIASTVWLSGCGVAQVSTHTPPVAQKPPPKPVGPVAIVFSNASTNTRLKALAKLRDQPDVLLKVVMEEKQSSEPVATQALEWLGTAELEHVKKNHRNQLWRAKANNLLVRRPIEKRKKDIRAISDEKRLRDIVMNPDEPVETASHALRRITNQRYLVQIAESVAVKDVLRRSAADSVTNEAAFINLVLSDVPFNWTTFSRLTGPGLLTLALRSPNAEVAKSAVKHLSSQSDLREVVLKSEVLKVRRQAIVQLTDEDFIQELIDNARTRQERLTAITRTRDKDLLRGLMSRQGNTGKVAEVRLITLLLNPEPEFRLGFAPSSRLYQKMTRDQRLSRRGGRGGYLELKGEVLSLYLLEPERHPRQSIKYKASFETDYPAVYESGFKPAKIRPFEVTTMLRDYLRHELTENQRAALRSTEIPILKQALALL